jgi:hypothetical protein
MNTYGTGTYGTGIFGINNGTVNPVSNETTITALDIIKRALRLIGIVASGESVASDEAQDGLMSLNAMIDSWKAQGIDCYPNSSTMVYMLNDCLSVPPGYNEALVFNLAVAIAPEYGKEASGTVMARANETLAIIKRKNIVVEQLKISADVMSLGSQGFYNIYTDRMY